MRVVRIEGYKLLDGSGIERAGRREVFELAQKYNLTAISKIHIYQSAQNLEYSIDASQEIRVQVRGHDVPASASEQIIQLGYLVINENLFFFDEDKQSELREVSKKVNPLLAATTLRKLPLGLRPSEKELEEYLAFHRGVSEPLPSVSLTATLYQYQIAGFDWLSKRYDKGLGGVLADDMGLGKTLQVIALIAEKLRTGDAKRILVVVPNSLIANWLVEFRKFTEGISPYVHWGPERVGFPQQLEKFEVVITTYGTIVNDIRLFKNLFFDIAVFDEASLVKNPESRRVKAVEDLTYGCGIAVTGTPFENSFMDLWSVTNVVSPDFLGQKDRFIETYVAQGLDQLSVTDIEKIESKIRPILLRRMKSEVLEQLPKRLDIHKPLTMNASERREYETLSELIRQNKNDKSSAFRLIAQLRKFSAHPLMMGHDIDNARFSDLILASAKFAFLASTLEKVIRSKEKALIFANHIKLLTKFVSCFSEEFDVSCFKIDGTVPAQTRQAVIDEFSDVEGSAILFLNPLTAGMGLNITAANHVIHYSRQWNPALEEQATARAYRNGQEKSVNVYYLYYLDSVEETIHSRLATKTEVAEGVVRATRLPTDESELILELI